PAAVDEEEDAGNQGQAAEGEQRVARAVLQVVRPVTGLSGAEALARLRRCRRWGGFVGEAHTFSDRSSPTMPLGRMRRIRIMARKAKVSLYSVMPANDGVRGKSAVRKFSRKPRSTPPTTAPGRLPMPPMTAAANALM